MISKHQFEGLFKESPTAERIQEAVREIDIKPLPIPQKPTVEDGTRVYLPIISAPSEPQVPTTAPVEDGTRIYLPIISAP